MDANDSIKGLIDHAVAVGHEAGPTEHEPIDKAREPIPLTSNPLDGLPNFPINALPAALQSAAREIARFSKTPLESAGTIALSMAATAIGKKARIAERPGLEHWPALFFSLIANSGERKSPPFKLLQRPFTDFILSKHEAHQEAKARHDASKKVVAARRAKLAKDAENAASAEERRRIADDMAVLEREKEPSPRPLRRFTTDATEPSLFRMMDESGGEGAIHSGEGRPVYDGIMGKYAGDGRTGDSMVLAGISGDTITRDRIGQADAGGEERREILSPCLNVCVMIQPDKHLQLASHPGLRTSGAIARIFPVWLPSLVGTRFEEPGEAGLDETALEGYTAALGFLLNATVAVPHTVRLGEAATEARRLLHNDVEGHTGAGGDYEDVRDIASKFTTQTVKLALVLHLLKRPQVLLEAESILDETTWREAELLGVYYLEHAVSTQRFADEGNENEPARRMWRWLANEVKQGRDKAFTAADMMQRSPRPRPKAKELAPILETLIEHRLVTEREDTSGQGKRPVYIVNRAAVEMGL